MVSSSRHVRAYSQASRSTSQGHRHATKLSRVIGRLRGRVKTYLPQIQTDMNKLHAAHIEGCTGSFRKLLD